MADRQTSDPRRDGERRPAPSRDSGRPAPREGGERRPGDTAERRQAPRNGGERRPGDAAERRQAPRGGGERQPRDTAERRPAPRDGVDRRQAAPRRMNVIRCENCGEDYSITYKRCPFCDERPGRGGISGKRVANTRGGGYGRPVNPIQVVWLIISLILIISALFIVFRFIGSPLLGGGKQPGSSSSSSSQGNTSQGDTSKDPGASSSGQQPGPDVSTPDDPTPPEPVEPDEIQGTINASGGLRVRSGPGQENGVVTTLANGTQVTILGEENGWYQIRYNGSSIGYVSKDYVITAGGTPPNTTQPNTTTPNTTTPSTTTPSTTTPSTTSPAAGTQGVITGADTGLNIRSGPGRDYDVVASAQNGASVTILGEENGWYQIRYKGNSTGYVSKDFVSVR